MKKSIILCLMLFLTISFFTSARVITSHPAGGNWASPDTWLGGQVPIDKDDAVLISKVEITDSLTVKNVLVNEGGTLTIKTAGDKIVSITDTLEVNGGLAVLKNSFLRVLVFIHSENAQLINESIIEVGKCDK